MWLTLARGLTRKVVLKDRQAIWPASELSDAELVVSTHAELEEQVLLATPQVIRLGYRITSIEGAFTIEGSPAAPWREAAAVKGQSFEIMLTSRGALQVPATGPKLPNRLASWLSAVAEGVRSAWPPLPDDLKAGATWSSAPLVPGGLPPGTSSASIEVQYRAGFVSQESADVAVSFVVRAALDNPELKASTAVGEGSMSLHLERRTGPTTVTRASVMSLVRPQSRDQVIRASVELVREVAENEAAVGWVAPPPEAAAPVRPLAAADAPTTMGDEATPPPETEAKSPPATMSTEATPPPLPSGGHAALTPATGAGAGIRSQTGAHAVRHGSSTMSGTHSGAGASLSRSSGAHPQNATADAHVSSGASGVHRGVGSGPHTTAAMGSGTPTSIGQSRTAAASSAVTASGSGPHATSAPALPAGTSSGAHASSGSGAHTSVASGAHVGVASGVHAAARPAATPGFGPHSAVSGAHAPATTAPHASLMGSPPRVTVAAASTPETRPSQPVGTTPSAAQPTASGPAATAAPSAPPVASAAVPVAAAKAGLPTPLDNESTPTAVEPPKPALMSDEPTPTELDDEKTPTE